MKTLSKHNEELRKRYRAVECGVGVSCDECGEELMIPIVHTVYTVMPPMVDVYCANDKCVLHGVAQSMVK